jgi:hypothetical protein
VRKSDFVLASVIMSAVIGLGVPCAAQLNAVVSSSGTFHPRTGSTIESMTVEPGLQRESLGTDMMEGVEAEGWRTTMTTAVGVIGNDKPLTRVCEAWHAVELKTLLLSNCSDVRSGRSTMRLKNLDRSEPDPSLFQVPPDYTIVDDRDRFTMNFNER